MILRENGKEWANKNFEKIKKLDDKKKILCENNNIKILYFTENEDQKNENTFTDLNKLFKKLKEYGKN